MKIARTQDVLSVILTEDEYSLFRLGNAERGSNRLRCEGTVDPTGQKLRLRFGTGRLISEQRITINPTWRVALDVHAARAQRLEVFGLTPTTFSVINARSVEVAIPEVRAPIKVRRTKLAGSASATYRSTPAPLVIHPKREVDAELTSAQLHEAKEAFNRAVSRGYRPQFDGAGRILWFDWRSE